DRLLGDPRSRRFVEDFLGQWLKLRQIAANDPDNKLYPEFNKYLQDSMLAETHAYFRELIDRDLTAEYLVKSDFAMLNGRLAAHYDIAGVSGAQVRRGGAPAGGGGGGGVSAAGGGGGGGGRAGPPPPPPRPAARPAPGAAAPDGPRGRAGRPRRHDDPRAAGQTPLGHDVRQLPREDRPAGVRPRRVRRHRRAPRPLPIARQGRPGPLEEH